MSQSAPRQAFELKGWHVLVALLLFFGGDIAINTSYIMAAYTTFPGEDSVTPYEDGLAYDTTWRQLQDQEARGWRFGAEAGADGRLEVRARDRLGAPLRGMTVSVKVARPATETGSATVALREAAPGVYVGAMATPLHGAWDLDVTAADREGRIARADRRLILP